MVTSDTHDLEDVKDKMEERRLTWNTESPPYHAWNNLFGINSNVYARDVADYAVGENYWKNAGIAPGQEGYEYYRPGKDWGPVEYTGQTIRMMEFNWK